MTAQEVAATELAGVGTLHAPDAYIQKHMANPTQMGAHDVVGATFFIAQNAMIAFTFFFFMERQNVPKHWQTSITIAAMVTLIASWNYSFMKDQWVVTQTSPTVFRYTDWLITVPLLMLEFYFVLAATTNCSSAVFWRILTSSLIMLIGGYMGESGIIGCLPGFAIGMCGLLAILADVFTGECAQLSASSTNKPGQKCFNTLRFLVSVGWSIYPLGYFCVLVLRGAASTEGVNVLYNLADVINKGFFGLAVWAAAKEDVKDVLM